MKNQIQFTLFALLTASASAKSRQWQELVDHTIAHASNVDSSRYELKIEADPFLKPAEKSPSKIPTEPQQDQMESGWNLINSIKTQNNSMRAPSNVGGFGSSFGAKNTEEVTGQTNRCENGYKYEIHMMDTWGDGWDNTMITITGIDRPTSAMETTHTDSQGGSFVSISKTIELDSTTNTNRVGQIFQGSLEQGFHNFKELCLLPNQCYQLSTTSGEFSDEVSWELRPAGNTQPMLIGGASTGCTFSPPDENGAHFCPNTCSNAAPVNVVQSFEPEGGTVQAQGRLVGPVTAATRTNSVDTHSMPVGLAAASSSLGNSKTASSIWNKFKNGE